MIIDKEHTFAHLSVNSIGCASHQIDKITVTLRIVDATRISDTFTSLTTMFLFMQILCSFCALNGVFQPFISFFRFRSLFGFEKWDGENKLQIVAKIFMIYTFRSQYFSSSFFFSMQ